MINIEEVVLAAATHKGAAGRPVRLCTTQALSGASHIPVMEADEASSGASEAIVPSERLTSCVNWPAALKGP